jgi:hypothetical protein
MAFQNSGAAKMIADGLVAMMVSLGLSCRAEVNCTAGNSNFAFTG